LYHSTTTTIGTFRTTVGIYT